jgi:hypothetical protein
MWRRVQSLHGNGHIPETKLSTALACYISQPTFGGFVRTACLCVRRALHRIESMPKLAPIKISFVGMLSGWSEELEGMPLIVCLAVVNSGKTLSPHRSQAQAAD